MKRTLVILIPLAAFAALWWFARGGGETGGGALAPSVAPEPGPPAATPAPETASLPPEPERPVERQIAPVAEEPAAAETHEPVAADEETITLEGTLVVEDEHGVEHAREDGALVLIFWRGQGGRGEEVAVEDGRWRAEVPRDAELTVGDVELGGRPAEVVAPRGRFAPSADGSLDVRARWLRAATLVVLDARTQEHLGDVTLVRAAEWPRRDIRHPGDHGDERVVLAHAASPIVLPAPDAARQRLHVGAPGHAWTLADVDAVEGGERIVALEPGAGLEVELVLGLVDPGAVLRVFGVAGPVAELDLEGRERFVLDGLPAGPARVAVQIGPWWDQPRELAEEEVTLVAGETATLRLEVADAPVSPPVPFGGVVVVPPEWELERYLLAIDLLDPPLAGRERTVRLSSSALEPVEGEPGARRWSLPNAQPGRYELLLFDLMHSISLEVGPAGDERVRFEVPPPGRIEVRVVDEVTGAPAAVEHVFWNGERPEWVRGGGMRRAERDADAGPWRIRAPQGRVEVHTAGGGYEGEERTVELGAEPVELELRVRRAYLVRVSLRDGETRVPWERGQQVRWRAAGADEERSVWVSGGDEVMFRVDAPGVYELTLPELAAYEAVPVQQVVVEDQPETEVVVPLTRRR